MMFKPVSRQSGPRYVAFVVLLTALAGICGCAGMTSSELSGPVAPGPMQGPALHGSTFGGQQPITGAVLQLYAAGTAGTNSTTTPGGYGGGATPLIATGSYFPGGAAGCVPATGPPAVVCTTLPTTDANGSFNITSDYTCPSATSQVYLVSTGGNPGNASGNSNPFATLMAALGPCSTLSPTTFISMNEITTVGSVYALAQFLSAPNGSGTLTVGAPGTLYSGVASGVVGLTNGFTWVNTLVNTSFGSTPGTNPFAIVESSQINTLADVLASCINSDPNNTGAPSSTCSTIMTDVTPAGQTKATDTLQAAYYMVRFPFNNVAKIFTDITATPPFVAETTQPIDFTLNVQLAPYYLSNATSPATNQPAVALGLSIAFDQFGNAWVAQAGQNVTSTSPAGSSSVAASAVELGPTGAVLVAPTAVFTALTTNSGGTPYGAYGEFTQAPTTNTRSFSFGNGTTAAQGVVAIDLSNNAWITNNRDSVLGTAANPTTTTGASLAVFPGSTAANQVNSGTAFGYYTAARPDGIAIDGNNNVFLAMTAGSPLASYDSIGEFVGGVGTAFNYSTSSNTAFPYKIPGGVTKVAIDANATAAGAPFLWTANLASCSLGALPGNLGSFNQFVTGTLVPSANSPFATSSSTCPVSNAIKTTFTASTTNLAFVAIEKNNGVLATNEYFTATNGFDGLTYLQTDTTGNVTNSVTFAASTAGTKGVNSVTTAGASLSDPFGIAVDGNNNVFVGNIGINSIAEFTLNPTTPSLTFNQLLRGPGNSPSGHQYSAPEYIAIDPSGNLWAPNSSNIAQTGLPIAGMSRGSTISVTIGIGAPVVTPLAAAIKGNRIGQKP